ncbi:MAG: NADH-quinone oxidoreductase subunit C [SAR202 cluster bacterium]|nr:NADH-quinone oxidoreductase subunit C [Dehalococcoidia bacterium]MQG10435.1 NADH-quinone oxidoreductase subunit C [SAR202 cluster bacterium]MQG55118.1 NADH-quinone oxidoreductase subunit C [SAR202 cluster bacterium]
MAEQEENQEPASPPAESSETPAAAAHAEPTPPADPLEALTPAGRELLDDFLDVLKEFDPQAGALDDIPQVSIDKKHTLDACRLMKDDPRVGAQMLLCLSCVDYTEYFQMVYVLQSLRPERTLVLRTDIPYSDATIPSVTSVWRAADWYEREAHDLFGVSFDGHPDLSPLLLYEGFEGYPGRKEFPFNEYQEF